MMEELNKDMLVLLFTLVVVTVRSVLDVGVAMAQLSNTEETQPHHHNALTAGKEQEYHHSISFVVRDINEANCT